MKMGRSELLGFQGRGGGTKWWCCSYKRTTLFICSINVVVAFYIVHCLYSSFYLYSNHFPQQILKYSPEQIQKMQESIRIRKDAEPRELIKVVEEVKKELAGHETRVDLPHHLKQMITDEILLQLRMLPANANVSEKREAVENFRKEKLQEVKLLATGETGNLTISSDEAGMLVEAMESKWSALLEEIGLWMPVEITHKEHDYKPEGADEFEDNEEPLPGRAVPAECHAELHTDYDGAAVRWGLTHRKESAADCCQACLDQAKHAKLSEKRCNIWVYCPSESGCYSPDIYEHKFQECWLKYAETPRLNFKDKYSESYRSAHPTAPLIVPWVSGVIGI